MDDFHSMSLAELKVVAKNHRPRIKQYYIKSKAELIQILTSKDLPETFKVEKMRIQELRDEARNRGYLVNLWKMRRKDLVDLLYPGANENDQNDDHTKKHDDPQECEGKEVGVQVLNHAC